jgi:hypothetical protein
VAAIEVALGAPDSVGRWLHGEHVFDRALFPDEANEARFLARFARQAKGQAQAEKRQLQPLLAIFEKTPGAWASYSTSGIAPL